MLNMYNLLKFLHVAAVTLWVGGVLALSVVNLRLGRRGDRAMLAVMARESAFYGRVVVGPAVGVVLLTGGAMAAASHLRFTTLWILWGFVGVVGFVLIGAGLIGRAGAELGGLAASASADEPRIRMLQRRLGMLTVANLLLLFSVIWAMVSKPTL